MQTCFLELSSGRLAYNTYGTSGEPVVMLPGMGALRSEYRFLGPRLAKAGFRAIALDVRGHGDSSVSWMRYDVPSVGGDILHLVDHLDEGPVHLVGTSKSAAAVVWAAVERPHLVRSIILIGPFVHQAKVNPVMRALFWLMMNNPWRIQAWIKYYGSLFPTHKPDDFSEYLTRLQKNLKEPGRFKAMTTYGNASLKESDERLSRVKAPSLVLMGTKDPDFPNPAKEAAQTARETQGELKLIEGAGHYPQTEMPEEAASVVIDFLKRCA
jgi:pimeloyl-ACP methyl ester carboxylesterase